MTNKTAQEHYDVLSEQDKGHCHTLAEHYKTGMHPQAKETWKGHAANDDHASMKAEVEKAAKTLGITLLSVGGVTWWLLKWLK